LESANLHRGFSKKKYISKYTVYSAGFASQQVLNKYPTVWLDGTRPPPRYISKYIKINIAALYINDFQLDKTIR
jgi:hypothetical protein